MPGFDLLSDVTGTLGFGFGVDRDGKSSSFRTTGAAAAAEAGGEGFLGLSFFTSSSFIVLRDAWIALSMSSRSLHKQKHSLLF